MSSPESPELLLAVFASDAGADDALRRLDDAEQQKLVVHENAAIIRKDARGEVRLESVGKHPVRQDIGHGALIGGALGLLFSPSVVAGAAAGGVIGGLIGALREGDFDEAALRKAAAGVQPNHSALLAVVEQDSAGQFAAALRAAGAIVATASVHADLAQQLRNLAAAQP